MLWHYTTHRQHFPKIRATGALIPTDKLIDEGERAAVWFSSDQYFEPTARKMERTSAGLRSLTMTEMHDRAGIVRIGVAESTAAISWTDFVKTSGVSRTTAENLKRAGKEHGADPYKWFASFDPVPRDQWVAVQLWDGSRWNDLDRSEW